MAFSVIQSKKNTSGKRKWLLPVIIVCLLLIIGTMLFVFRDYLHGMWLRNFGTAEELFTYTQQRQLRSFSKVVASGYDQLFYPEEGKDFGYCCDMELGLSDALLPDITLPDGTAVSSEFLSDIKLSLTGGNWDRLRQDQVRVNLSDVPVLSIDVIGDTYSGQQWIAFPELHTRYIHFTQEAEETGTLPMTSVEMKQLLPTAEDVEMLMNRYGTAALSHIRAVEKREEVITVGEISQTLLLLTAQMEERDLLQMRISLLRQLREDGQIKGYLTRYGEYYNDSLAYSMGDSFVPVDVYKAFQTDIDEQIVRYEQQLASAENDRSVCIQVFLDGQNNVAGYRITGPQEQVLVSWLMVFQKQEFSLQAQADTHTLSGSGTAKQGTVNGNFTVSENADTLFSVRLEECSWGLLPKGTACIQKDAYTLTLNVQGTQGGATLQHSGTQLCRLAASVRLEAPRQIAVPSDAFAVTDSEAGMQWVAEANFSQVLENLRQAGAPEPLLAYLQAYLTDQQE